MKRILLISLLGFHMLFCEGRGIVQIYDKNGKNTAVVLDQLLKKSRYYMSASSPHNLDSALLYAENAELLASGTGSALLGDAYLLEAEIFAKQKHQEKGKIQAQKAVMFFSAKRPKTKLAESYMQLAANYPEYDTALTARIRLYEMAAQIFGSEKDTLNQAAALKSLGYDLLTDGKIDESLAKLNQSLKLYQAVGYKQTQEVYSLIGLSYTQKGLYTEALRYSLQAVRLVGQFKDTSQVVADIYNTLAVAYSGLRQYDKVEEYVKKAFVIAERGTDIDVIMALAANIADVLTMQNRPEEGLIFLMNIIDKYPASSEPYVRLQVASKMLSMAVKTKRYNKAGIYSKELISISAKLPTYAYDQLLAYPTLVEYYIAVHQYDNARKYLEPYYKMVQDAGVLSGLKETNKFWFVVDSAKGNYLSAIQHLKKMSVYNDSIYNKNRLNEISALQVQFETEKKEKDIQLLTKQSQLQKSHLQQANFMRNVTLAGIGVTLFIISLLYSRYKLKQRSNKRLEQQQKEINDKNTRLQHLLTEKEWLLKEIHHRIKNNLQTVMSLLSSQSAYLQDEAALTAIQDSRHRIHAMSLIHQKLYTTDNVSEIDMPVYIQELVGYMRDSFDTGQRIRFDVDITPMKLDIAQAIPLALILNEAITNALKYAFPDGRNGVISISLQHKHHHTYILDIKDNGIGMPVNAQQENNSLGMSLMKGLSEDLDGSLEIDNNNGTTIRIWFVQDVTVNHNDTTGI